MCHTGNMLILALLPMLVLIILILVYRFSVSIASALSLVVALPITIFAWHMSLDWVNASLIKGFLISLDIGLILFSAIWLASILKQAQVFVFFKHFVTDITTDKRFQAVLLGWFGVAIIEGASGFGTPTMLIAPLLVSLGFKPKTSVIVCLLGNSISSVFGASGVPITIGLVEGISQLPGHASISIPLVIAYKTTLFMLTGSLVPMLITMVVAHLELGSWKKSISSWPFAFLSGAIYTAISLVISSTLGPELPSLLAGLIGLVIMSVYAATHPKLRDQVENVLEKFYTKKDIAKAILPYVTIIALLSLSRATYLHIGAFLRSTGVTIALGTTNLTHSINLLYSPGIILILVSMICIVIYRISWKHSIHSLTQSLNQLLSPLVSLSLLLMLITLLRYSGNNTSLLPSIPAYIGTWMSQFSIGQAWILVAPIIGAMGAFLAGSVTVSNMMLATIQVEAGAQQGVQPELILALQSLGAGLGNMFALHNVIAGLSVVKSMKSLRQIISFNALVSLFLLLFTGLAALVIW